jgi:hypothetical protein
MRLGLLWNPIAHLIKALSDREFGEIDDDEIKLQVFGHESEDTHSVGIPRALVISEDSPKIELPIQATDS